MSRHHDQWARTALKEPRAVRGRQARRRTLALGAAVVAAAVIAVLISDTGNGSPTQLAKIAVGQHLKPTASAAGASRTRGHPGPTLAARENAAIDHLLKRQPFIRWGGRQRREIALTFDDGPGPYTPKLLDQLTRLHVPATFFEIGFMFQWFHTAAVRQLHMGDVIGDHTESHPPMALLSPTAQRAQILDQTQRVHKYGGPFPRLWRPPYGSYNHTTLQILHHLHMLMVLWTVDTEDYTRPGVAVIVHRALAGARPGAIILMHDAGGNRTQTVAALPLIVDALRARGYQLVTVPQLILDDPPKHSQPLPTNLPGD